MSPEITVTTGSEDSIEEEFLMAMTSGDDESVIGAARREAAEEDEAEGAPDSDANARARSRELREGAEGNRAEAFDKLPARDGKVGSDAGDPLAELTEKFGMSIQKVAERAKVMAESEDPNLAAQGKGILGLIEEGEALVAPFISPVDALSGGFAGGAKLAGRAGVQGVARLGRGLASGASAAATEIPAGLAVEGVAENHPALAFPFAVFLGIAVGGTFEAALERGMFRGSKTVINLWKIRKAAKIEAGISPEKAAEIAIKEVVAESEPSDVLALAKTVKEVEGSIASSANRNKNLTREEAIEVLKGPEHQTLRRDAERIDQAFGIKSKRGDALGRYKGSSEPSLTEDFVAGNEGDVRLKAALQGKAHDQEMVIYSVHDPEGPHVEYEATIPTSQASINEIDDALEAAGVRGWSLEPKQDGTRVKILDTDGSDAQNIQTFADHFGIDVGARRVRIESVKRDDYDGIIGQAKAERPDRLLGLEADAGARGGDDADIPAPGERPRGTTEEIKGPEGQVTPPGPPEPEPVTIRKATPEEIKRFVETDPSAVKVGDKHVLKIDFSAIGTQADMEGVINRVTAFYRDSIDAARRGTISRAETKKMAEALHMTVDDLLKERVGGALLAEEIEAFKAIFGASTKKLLDLHGRFKAGDVSAREPFAEHFGLHLELQKRFFGSRAESGRALPIWGTDADGIVSFNERLGEAVGAAQERADSAVLRDAGGSTGVTVEELADMIAALETPAQLAKFSRSAARPGKIAMLFEVWINSLISGPLTQVVNITGSVQTLFLGYATRALAARLGRGGVEVGEATVALYGGIQSFTDALRIGWKSARTGVPVFGESKLELEPGSRTALTAENLELTGVPGRAVDLLGSAFRVPGRALTGVDSVFKVINYRAELHALSFRKAISEGLEGDALARRTQELIDETPASLRAEAEQFALYQTFTNELGDFGKRIQHIANHPAGKIIAPFVRTTTNITKMVVEFGPLRLAQKSFYTEIRAGGARRQLALAKLSLGSMVMATTAVLTAAGRISGGGPKDANLRRQKRNTGWQPYSIRIGDTWHSYGRFDPLGMMIGMAADFAASVGEMDQVTADKIGAALVGAVAKNLTSKTYMRGVAGALTAATDPDRNLANEAMRLVSSFVPFSGLLSQTNKALFDPVLREARAGASRTDNAFIDPVLAQARSMLNAVMAKTPGLSDDLPPRRNIFAEPVTLEGGVGPDIMSPVFTSRVKKDPVDIEIDRLGVPFGMPPRSIQGVELSAEEYDRFIVLAGKEIKTSSRLSLKPALDKLFKSNGYKASEDGRKEIMIRKIIRGLRKRAVDKLLPEFPRLAELVQKARVKKRDARGLIPR